MSSNEIAILSNELGKIFAYTDEKTPIFGEVADLLNSYMAEGIIRSWKKKMGELLWEITMSDGELWIYKRSY